MREPFALELHRRFLSGESAERLAAELHIPLDRIEMRLQAAEMYLNLRQPENDSTAVLAGSSKDG